MHTIGNYSFKKRINLDIECIKIKAYDAGATATENGSFNFSLTVNQNQGPVKGNSIPNQTVAVGVGLNYTLPAGIFTDTEGEAITYTCSVLNSPSFITFSNP